MNQLARIIVFTLLLPSFSGVLSAQEHRAAVDGYAVLNWMHANAPVGGCGCFWMTGGHGGFSVPIYRDFSAVVEAGGNNTSQIPNFNTGLSLFYGMGGLRVRAYDRHHIQPFAQALFGGVHGFNGYFPAPVGRLPTSYDTSFAMTLGGGIDVAVSKYVWIRAVQADYFYSELRNNQGDRQNQFRIGVGVLFRGPGRNQH